MKLDTVGALNITAAAAGSCAFDSGEFLAAVKDAIEQRNSENAFVSQENGTAQVSEKSSHSEKDEYLQTIFEQIEKHRRCRFLKEKHPEHPTAEELKEVAKARARRKARLDAYFHTLEKVCIKRKLVEQENAKRVCCKKYRSVTELGLIAKSRQLTTPPKNPDYFF